MGVARVTGEEIVIAATAEGRGLLCKLEEINFLSGPGKGVILIKLADEDRVLGFIASSGDRDLLTVETTRGAEQTISTAKYEVTGRGGKGRELLQRGQFTRILRPVPEAPPRSAAGRGTGAMASVIWSSVIVAIDMRSQAVNRQINDQITK